ncbi:response regulator transcription factor [SAR202 cluster bacterium AC-647-N09_OGT_505m]|nr:response regulator transcription factor [SAR202 cluster bacterium AC-647-N09_OGT_505m]
MAPVKRILLLAALDERANFRPLEDDGFILSFSQDPRVLENIPLEETPNLLMVDLGILPVEDQAFLIQHCKNIEVSVIVMIPEENRFSVDPTLEVEDFIFLPVRHHELRMRIRRALWRTGGWDSGQIIRNGDLIIDPERYEISVAGRRIILTFKEYQLLCLLATNPGRVYSRETLLSRVWGYDYFGGTRTVDVHIRRLRSKVEDATHLFIETVRNVGYRFRVA